MSFNIPIFFDDSPFSDWGDMRRPQHRRNQQRTGRRQPSVFGQWEDPDIFYDYPTRKHHHRPNYDPRQQQYKRESRKNRFDDEGAQEDIYDTEEHEEAPRSNFGHDWWDIPVQHMDRPSHKHHKHKHKQEPKLKSRASKGYDIANDSEEPKLLQRKVNKSNEATSDTESKIGHSSEAMKVKTEKQSEVFPEKENMEQQTSKTNPESKATESSSETTESSTETTESSSLTNELENNESTEIPITHRPSKNTRRRFSKRLSQCDPPSPADIKLARIQSIVQKTEGIEEKIKEFIDPVQNKNFLYISETLMKILLDLDTVDSEGFDVVRKARKEGVKSVQALVDKLEDKLEENKNKSNPK